MIKVHFKRTGLSRKDRFAKINRGPNGVFTKEFKNILELIKFLEKHVRPALGICCVDLRADLTDSQWYSYCQKQKARNIKDTLEYCEEHPEFSYKNECLKEHEKSYKRMLKQRTQAQEIAHKERRLKLRQESYEQLKRWTF